MTHAPLKGYWVHIDVTPVWRVLPTCPLKFGWPQVGPMIILIWRECPLSSLLPPFLPPFVPSSLPPSSLSLSSLSHHLLPPPPPSPSPSLSQSLSFCLSLGHRKRHLCVRIYTGVLCAYAVSLACVPGDRSGCECWKVCRVGRFEAVSSMIAGSIDCGGG